LKIGQQALRASLLESGGNGLIVKLVGETPTPPGGVENWPAGASRKFVGKGGNKSIVK